MGAANQFASLPAEKQSHHKKTSQQFVRIARNCAIPIVLAPAPALPGKINHATGFALELGSGLFFVTASHVLTDYEIRLRKDPNVVNWQVGNLRPFNPLERTVWRSVERIRDDSAAEHGVRLPVAEGANRDGKDIVIMRLLSEEGDRLRLNPDCVISTPAQWPPTAPAEQDVVMVAGYPLALRETDRLTARIGAGPYSAMFRVTSRGDGYFVCRLDQQDLISFDGAPLPALGSENARGLSGGPALLVGMLHYPVVGVIIEWDDLHELHLLRVATLDDVREEDLNGSKPELKEQQPAPTAVG